MFLRHLIAAIGLVGLVGCGGSGQSDVSSTGNANAGTVAALSDADLDRFLAIVEAHGAGEMPQFSNDESSAPGAELPASELLSRYRTQFRVLFDPVRQGRVWEQDERWSQALRAQNTSGSEFAALARTVSLSILRVRIKSRIDLERLVANARAEVQDLASTIEAIDELPSNEQTAVDQSIRAQSVLRLARGVSLAELVQLIEGIPEANCDLVRRHSQRLKSLLPQGATEPLLAELESLGGARPGSVTPAGYIAPPDRAQ
ncbi:MAG: hypothetical protein ACKV0T_16965 [Planctomycetales bacterium]